MLVADTHHSTMSRIALTTVLNENHKNVEYGQNKGDHLHWKAGLIIRKI